MRAKQKASTPSTRISLAKVKAEASRLLRPGHPLLRILETTPDEISADELAARVRDWIVILEE